MDEVSPDFRQSWWERTKPGTWPDLQTRPNRYPLICPTNWRVTSTDRPWVKYPAKMKVCLVMFYSSMLVNATPRWPSEEAKQSSETVLIIGNTKLYPYLFPYRRLEDSEAWQFEIWPSRVPQSKPLTSDKYTTLFGLRREIGTRRPEGRGNWRASPPTWPILGSNDIFYNIWYSGWTSVHLVNLKRYRED